jgi:hypothetical protein
LQRTFFPWSSIGPFNCFLQCGHRIIINAGIDRIPCLQKLSVVSCQLNEMALSVLTTGNRQLATILHVLFSTSPLSILH